MYDRINWILISFCYIVATDFLSQFQCVHFSETKFSISLPILVSFSVYKKIGSIPNRKLPPLYGQRQLNCSKFQVNVRIFCTKNRTHATSSDLIHKEVKPILSVAKVCALRIYDCNCSLFYKSYGIPTAFQRLYHQWNFPIIAQIV